MNREHDGLSECASSNISLLMESAREVIDDIRELSQGLEAGLRESASLDEIITALTEKRDKVRVLRDLSREITVSLGAAETGATDISLSGPSKQQLMELIGEFQELISEESGLEGLLARRGIKTCKRRK